MPYACRYACSVACMYTYKHNNLSSNVRLASCKPSSWTTGHLQRNGDGIVCPGCIHWCIPDAQRALTAINGYACSPCPFASLGTARQSAACIPGYASQHITESVNLSQGVQKWTVGPRHMGCLSLPSLLQTNAVVCRGLEKPGRCPDRLGLASRYQIHRPVSNQHDHAPEGQRLQCLWTRES